MVIKVVLVLLLGILATLRTENEIHRDNNKETNTALIELANLKLNDEIYVKLNTEYGYRCKVSYIDDSNIKNTYIDMRITNKKFVLCKYHKQGTYKIEIFDKNDDLICSKYFIDNPIMDMCKVQQKMKKNLIKLQWKKQKNIDYYEVYYGSKINGRFRKIAKTKANKININTIRSKAVDLTKTKYFKIVAFRKIGNRVLKSEETSLKLTYKGDKQMKSVGKARQSARLDKNMLIP